MDLVKLESVIEALESELSQPSPQHFNLTRLVALGLKEVSALLRYLHGKDTPQITITGATAGTLPTTVSSTLQDPEPMNAPLTEEKIITGEIDLKDAAKDDNVLHRAIEVPVASPITEAPKEDLLKTEN